MTTAFANSLEIALDKINKPQWQGILEGLAQNFSGIPYHDIDFENELLSVLWSLQPPAESDPSISVEVLMSIRLPKMTAWTLRALNKNEGQHEAWNPLHNSFSEFKNETTEVMQKSAAYPAEDIIKRWSKDNLH